jgi:hypothetical protein
MNRRAIPVIAVALVIGVLADLPFDAPLFPGYNALIGLGGTILLVLVAKQVLSPLVDRDESYYDDDVPPDVQHDVWARRADDVEPRGGSDV